MGGKERLHVGLGTASRWCKLRRNCQLWFPTMHQNSQVYIYISESALKSEVNRWSRVGRRSQIPHWGKCGFRDKRWEEARVTMWSRIGAGV